MKITLTGASGFIGTHVFERIQDKHQVQCLKHTLPLDGVVDSIRTFQPDVILHIGTFFVATHRSSDIANLIDSNLKWPAVLLDAAVESGTKIFINTGTCWQSWRDSEIPATLHASTKSAFESTLKFYSSSHGLKVMNLWLLDTYGSNDKRGKLISKLIECFQNQIPLEMSPGDQYLNLTHVSDVVDGFEQALKMTSSQDYQGFQSFELTHPHEIKLKDLVRLLEEVSNKKNPIKLGARPYRTREVMKPSHPHNRLPDWYPKIDLATGLKRLFK